MNTSLDHRIQPIWRGLLGAAYQAHTEDEDFIESGDVTVVTRWLDAKDTELLALAQCAGEVA